MSWRRWADWTCSTNCSTKDLQAVSAAAHVRNISHLSLPLPPHCSLSRLPHLPLPAYRSPQRPLTPYLFTYNTSLIIQSSLYCAINYDVNHTNHSTLCVAKCLPHYAICMSVTVANPNVHVSESSQGVPAASPEASTQYLDRLVRRAANTQPEHSMAQHTACPGQHTVQHTTTPHSTAHSHTTQHSTAHNHTIQHSTAHNHTTPYSTQPHHTPQYSTQPHHTVQHTTTPHSTVQHTTTPYRSTPYSTQPHHTAHNHTIQHTTTPHRTAIPHHGRPDGCCV